MKKYYDILGLKEGASKLEIQEAYDRLSKELKPELNNNHEFFYEEFAELEEAYNILMNKKVTKHTKTSLKPSNNNDSLKNSTNIYQNSFFIIVILLISLFLLIIKLDNEEFPETVSNENNTADSTYKDTSNSVIDSNYSSSESIDTLNIYYGNQLENGTSPLDDCFGNGEYTGNATLTIENGDYSDAIVCLYDVILEKTIRNEYIQKNSNFTMSRIGEGYYKIRVLSGNDWNPLNKNNCGGKGVFERDISFYEFENTIFFQDSNGKYSTNTITLFGIEGGNAKSTSINEDEFFTK